MITEIIFCGNRINYPNRLGLEIQISIALSNGSDEIHILFGSQGGEIFQSLEFYKFISNLPDDKKDKLFIHSCGPIESSAVIFFLSFNNRNISDKSSFKLHKVRLKNMSNLTAEKQKNIDCFNNQMLNIITSKVTLKKDEVESLTNTYNDLDLTNIIAIQKNFGVKNNRVFQKTAITIPDISQ